MPPKPLPEASASLISAPMWPDSPKQLKRARIWSELQHTRPSGQQGRKAREAAEHGEHPFLEHDEFQDGHEPFTGGVRRNWIRAGEVCTLGIYQSLGSSSVAVATAIDVLIGQKYVS